MVLLPEPETPITIKAQGHLSGLSFKLPTARCAIHQKNGFADGARPVCRQAFVVRKLVEYRTFFLTRDLEQHLVARGKRRQSERYPRHEGLNMGLRYTCYPALGLGERRIIRK